MINFKEWFLWRESTKSNPKKHSKKKVVPRPDHSIDGFVREMELLKKDLAALADKKTRDQHGKSIKPIKQEMNDDLMNAAKVVIDKLRDIPNYYSRRDYIDRLAGLERHPTLKKVSREDIKNVAKEFGIDFNTVKFTPEAFRKAIESELTQPSPSRKVSPGQSSKFDKDSDGHPPVDMGLDQRNFT